MQTTTYYDLNIVEGTDIVNPLTIDNPNYEKIDEEMHKNAVSGVTLATEIANATVHAINRENSECSVIRFIATSNWKAGDTVTVDGVPVTALLPSGETLPDGAYVINANVLCILTGTNLNVYVERKKIDNATEIVYEDTNVAEELTSLNDKFLLHPFKIEHFLNIAGGNDNKLVIDPVSDTLPDGMYIVKIRHTNLGRELLSGIVFVVDGIASFYGYTDPDNIPQRGTPSLKIPCQGWASTFVFYKVYM